MTHKNVGVGHVLGGHINNETSFGWHLSLMELIAICNYQDPIQNWPEPLVMCLQVTRSQGNIIPYCKLPSPVG